MSEIERDLSIYQKQLESISSDISDTEVKLRNMTNSREQIKGAIFALSTLVDEKAKANAARVREEALAKAASQVVTDENIEGDPVSESQEILQEKS